jgi:hypothetical protein
VHSSHPGVEKNTTGIFSTAFVGVKKDKKTRIKKRSANIFLYLFVNLFIFSPYVKTRELLTPGKYYAFKVL